MGRRAGGDGRLWLVVAAAAIAGPAVAQQNNCWTDATPNECPNEGWHVLRFKNGCSGGERTVNVCVKWTSGVSNGVVTRLFGFANGGGVAEIYPGLCDNGAISYNWQYDGSTPDCPK